MCHFLRLNPLYKNEKDVLPYSISLLIEFSNSFYSKNTLSKKNKNIDLDRDSTEPLEHTFGRSRIKCKNIHTIGKFTKTVGEINEQSLSKISEDIEKVKGRSLNFCVIIEDITSAPQQIAHEFLSLFEISPENQNEFENLFAFVEYLYDFIEEKSTRPFTVNRITKTINQRIYNCRV